MDARKCLIHSFLVFVFLWKILETKFCVLGRDLQTSFEFFKSTMVKWPLLYPGHCWSTLILPAKTPITCAPWWCSCFLLATPKAEERLNGPSTFLFGSKYLLVPIRQKSKQKVPKGSIRLNPVWPRETIEKEEKVIEISRTW